MTFSRTTKVAAYLMAMTAASMVQTGGPQECNVPEENWEELVTQNLSTFPDLVQIYLDSDNFERMIDYFVRISPGNITIWGLSNLYRDGAIQTFCKQGRPYIELKLLSGIPLSMNLAFKYCNEDVGTLTTTVNAAKLRVRFEVEEKDNRTGVRATEIDTLWLQSISVSVSGVGDFANTVVHFLGMLFASYVEEFWISQLSSVLPNVFVNVFE